MSNRISQQIFAAGRILFKPSKICRCKLDSNNTQLLKSRLYATDKAYKVTDDENVTQSKKPNLSIGARGKYKIFQDDDSTVIFDVDEEKKKIDLKELNAPMEEKDSFEGINLNRGTNGVFEIEHLIDVLKKDKAVDIFVATVPKEYAYVDYIVVVTGKSQKHMIALAQFVRKIYKIKREKGDRIPKIEGKKSQEWLALDLGNIALHIFSSNVRKMYDLETLWTVGSLYDDETHKTCKSSEIFEKYNAFLANLEPADA
ncbi:uncharacterized protein LOC105702806 [Orussus abietinus]|uniref:uncharacterized protein LOC105702806 n=1 Tax=Orussus abietinus TaxID=222816 RepID=UPI000625AFB2|nr:uncharacterized protein LOC105702806 [Orussus abietinus]